MRKVLKFSATWCGPCKKFAPIFTSVAKEYPTSQFVEIDVDVDPELAMRYGVQSVPTVVILDGDEVSAFGKPTTYNGLVDMLERT